MIEQYFKWIEVANFAMKYELMVNAKEQTVNTLSEILKLESVEPKTIVTELE